jgi:branched-chain amino acid transport system substrate-binding protein
VREAAGDAVNGVTYTVPAPGSGEVFRRFAEAYKAKYGTEPNYNAAAAYDSVMVLAEAAKSARSIDAAGLADALAGVKGFQGASGLISFDANGDVVSKAYDIMRIEHGKPIVSQSGVTVK